MGRKLTHKKAHEQYMLVHDLLVSNGKQYNKLLMRFNDEN
ncbi:hypothetical protein QFZ80_000057 [Paenibacillus sp. V4I7]|nr:hypothetical protein [Paenibacillus sp. V4I7]MDQ0913955.1 hypothetical protein [Paenibacillus sp. V4I5]